MDRRWFAISVLTCTLFWAASAWAQISPPRMVRTPDIHGDRVVFSAEGDLWLGSLAAGSAERVTTHEGMEENPRFSPDGAWIAFTAGYDGGQDVYVMAAAGGLPRRLTYDPTGAEMIGWSPDGAKILFRSRRAVPVVGPRLYLVPMAGGLPEPLPMERAAQGSFAPDGARLAYCRLPMERHHWKRYRGGEANQIWIADLQKNSFKRVHEGDINEQYPVWVGEEIFYVSEKDGSANLWRFDTRTGEAARVTSHTDLDVKAPASDGKRVIYQCGDALWIYDVISGATTQARLALTSDRIHARPVYVTGEPSVFGVGPTGKRLVLEDRGMLFTIPAEKGEIRSIAAQPGTRAKEPAWSPDGKQIVFISDRSGEENLWLAPASGTGEPVQVTRLEKLRLAGPQWSPDGIRIAFQDHTLALRVVDVKTAAVTEVARAEYGDINDYRFSPDGKWLAYVRPENYFVDSLYLYNLQSKQSARLTSTPTRERAPAFDPDGKYVYFLSERNITPKWDGVDFQMNHEKTTKLCLIALAKDTMSPLPVESDEEPAVESEAKKDSEKKPEGAEKSGSEKGKASAAGKEGESKPEWPPKLPDMKVHLDGIERRLVELPVEPGNYVGIEALADKVLYLAREETKRDGEDGGPPEPALTLKAYEFKEKKETDLATGIAAIALSFDRKKLALKTKDGFQIVDAGTAVKPDAPKVSTEGWRFEVNPELEWKQIFSEAWRQHRDLFYDPKMHGMDWDAIRKKYEALLPAVGARSELNEIIGDMQAELNVSHEYVGGGYNRRTPPKPPAFGALGAELGLDKDTKLYRFTRLFDGDGFDGDARSPLLAPGLRVKEGDYLLAINGVTLKPELDPTALLIDQAKKVVALQVNDRPSVEGARVVRVKAMSNERDARYYDWVRRNRDYVATHGGPRLGYLHLPDMSRNGMAELAKHFYANLDKDGLVIDVRYNGGGITSGMVLERLNRVIFEYDQGRYGMPEPYHRTAYLGRVVALCNERTGSDGEYFMTGFRMMKLGPSVGTRTWGGFMAVNGFETIDGGFVSTPVQGSFSPDGKWLPDGYGFNPDVVVEEDPNAFQAGRDPQLDKAIELLKAEIQKNPPRWPMRMEPPSAEKAQRP
ncbi:MAG: LpqB family beta-propeller domain-containing protein [Acidobacteriota bacterium]